MRKGVGSATSTNRQVSDTSAAYPVQRGGPLVTGIRRDFQRLMPGKVSTCLSRLAGERRALTARRIG